MRILVSCIPYDGGKSGISVHIREVVRALAAQGHELTLLTEPGNLGLQAEAQNPGGKNAEAQNPGGKNAEAQNLGGAEAQNKGSPSCRDLLAGSRVFAAAGHDGPALREWRGAAMKAAPRWTRRPVLSMLWHLFVLPFWIWRHRREFDGFAILAANRRVCAFYPLPTTATIHDLANFHIPGKYSRLRMFYLAHILPHFAKKAQHLVAVSGATKADMVEFWHCRPERVTVLYNGLPNDLGKNAEAQDQAGPVPCCGILAAVLYISRIEHPGKNHVRLIEAYSSLPPELAAAHPLVLAGADWKDADTVHAAAERSPFASQIRFTGFVPDDKMEALWASAGFYVFPSLFEGFGLSLAEAMARGIPCACSNNGSLGEIAGDAAATFDPADADDIARALRTLLSETAEERAARVARGIAQASRFSWHDHAAGLVRLLSEE